MTQKIQISIKLERPITLKSYRGKEVWKDVPGYPNFQASNMGRVRSVRVHVMKPRRIFPTLSDEPSYPVISIGQKKVLVHKMVAAAFYGKQIPEGMIVHHRDNDKGNPKVWNLELVTPSMNTKYAYEDGRIGSNYILSPLQRRKVVELYSSGDYLTRELAEMFDVHKATIISLLNAAGCPLHHFKKLNPQKRELIKSEYAAGGVSMKELAVKFGVSGGTIENVLGDRPGGRRKSLMTGRKNVRAVEQFFRPQELSGKKSEVVAQ